MKLRGFRSLPLLTSASARLLVHPLTLERSPVSSEPAASYMCADFQSTRDISVYQGPLCLSHPDFPVTFLTCLSECLT